MPEWPDVQVLKGHLDATSLHRQIETVEVAARAGYFFPRCQEKKG
ncbi:MAG: hypothetical protein PVF47_08655 [Anaerolineae bacterium]